MAIVYKHEYQPLSVYGNIISLLGELGSREGVHIDLGCGYGAIAEPIRDELKRDYIGFDLAEDGLDSLRERGFEAHQIDLSDLAGVENIIKAALRGRKVASLSFGDVLEHVTNGEPVLAMLSRLAASDNAPLVLSVPNIAHKDIALKLLLGRWDITEAGLLDHTHVNLYNKPRLDGLMRQQGWREIGARDWLLEKSDQHFPADLPIFDVKTPAGNFARTLLDRANPYALVNQFVRAYRLEGMEKSDVAPSANVRNFFLSILLIFDSSDQQSVLELLQELDGQTVHNFELILIPNREFSQDEPRILKDQIAKSKALADRTTIRQYDAASVAAALNEAVVRADGAYISVLKPSDRITPDWVSTFRELDGSSPGAVLRANREDQVQPPSHHALLPEVPTVLSELVTGRPRSIADIAVPKNALTSFGIRFVPELGDAAEFDVVAQVAMLCGIALSDVVTVRGVTGKSKAIISEEDGLRVLSRLNSRPILLPAGAAERIQRLIREKSWFETQHEELVSALQEAGTSNETLREAVVQLEKAEQGLRESLHGSQVRTDELEHRLIDLNEIIRIERDRSEEFAERTQALEGNLTVARPLIEMLEDAPQLASLFEFHRPGMLSRSHNHEANIGGTPFLSIITRTQGMRARTLRDVLMTLAGQSCPSFELILVVHSEDEDRVQATRSVVEKFPQGLRDRITVLQCTRPGRSAPINDALEVAKGQYFSVLDDDDFAFGHWVETFLDLARESPGSVLRAVCTRQTYEMAPSKVGEPRPRATSSFQMEWPSDYDPLRHLYENLSPFMTVAFPLGAFKRLGFRFDESLTTAEDWDLTTRIIMLCGVRTSREITAIYRWWTNGESSLFLHKPEQWVSNRQRVLDKLDAKPVVLPPGTVRGLVAVYEAQNALRASLAESAELQDKLRRELESAGAYQAGLEREIEAAGAYQASLEQQVEAARTQQASFDREIEAAGTYQANLEQEIEAARARQAVLEREIEAAGAYQANLEQEVEAARTQQAGFDQEVEAARRYQANLEQQIKTAGIAQAKLKQDVLSSRAQSDALRERIRRRSASIKASRAEAAALKLSFRNSRFAIGRKAKDKIRITQLAIEVLESGLFDRDWYFERYHDVRENSKNAAFHFVTHGLDEHRDPGPDFDTALYLRLYPDVAASNMKPFLHYLRYGMSEGRQCSL